MQFNVLFSEFETFFFNRSQLNLKTHIYVVIIIYIFFNLFLKYRFVTISIPKITQKNTPDAATKLF